MTEEKLKGTLYDDQEAVKHFRDFENRYYQQVTVTGVTGSVPTVMPKENSTGFPTATMTVFAVPCILPYTTP